MRRYHRLRQLPTPQSGPVAASVAAAHLAAAGAASSAPTDAAASYDADAAAWIVLSSTAPI